MKLMLEGTPEELVAFLEGRALPFSDAELVAAVPFPVPKAEPIPDEPKDKPPVQTIAPTAIEKLEFGVDSTGAPVDVAAVHRKIGELLRSASFQREAASKMPTIDSFEPPMIHAKRYMLSVCVRDNLFNLAVLDALCLEHVDIVSTESSQTLRQNIVTFEGV